MIVREFAGTVLRAGGVNVNNPVLVELVYDPTNPYAVKTSFSAPGEEAVVWHLGRELLWKGVRSRSALGDGDVRVRASGPGVVLCLRSPEGHADIGLPLAEVDQFLADTIIECPFGHEDVDARIDRILADILGEAA